MGFSIKPILIQPILKELDAPQYLYLKYLIAGLMIAGFGVKAGMIPLHIWLPDAHPIAPSPASALLSGIMIKAGAYGIIRVVGSIFRPPLGEIEAGEHLWEVTSSLGYGLIW